MEIGSEKFSDEVTGRGQLMRNLADADTDMSSSGEIKISLKLMTWYSVRNDADSLGMGSDLTFSCRKCFRSFNSRYVRLERTGVLKGFMIFLIATAWLVSWSFAELR